MCDKGNLTSAVYETGLKYKELNNKPEIQILIEVEEENMVLFFDKEVITMILDNLISNALKYTEKDISVSAPNGLRKMAYAMRNCP